MARTAQLRILCFSDLHCNEKAMKALSAKAKKADLLICAGDFTIFEHNINHVLRTLDKMGKPIMLVNGNHEDAHLTAGLCAKTKHIRQIHRHVHEEEAFPGYAFIGHGGEGFDFVSEDFESFAKAQAAKLRALKGKGTKLIFITHQPPHNTKLDYIWAHHGSKSYTRFDKKHQPVLHVCGHLHETQGKTDFIGKTKIINPGPFGAIVKT